MEFKFPVLPLVNHKVFGEKMIPDPIKKNVLIPIRILKGEPHFLYGGELPKLAEGTIGDLIVPRYSVIDKQKLSLLELEETKVFIPKPATLMVQVSPKDKDAQKPGIMKLPLYPYKNGLFVKIVLEEDLNINLRSTKKGELQDCLCSIPSMPEAETKSINHSYSIISQHYETHRRSHSGNVFDKVFFWNDRKLLKPLKELRNNFEAEYEQELIILNKIWYYKENPTLSEIMWVLVEQKDEKKYNIYCINRESKITEEQTFDREDHLLRWLKKNEYHEYDIEILSVNFPPPATPYTDMNGEIVILNFDI